MDESEFRSFWMALGAALFAGGLVVGVSSGVTVGLTQLPHGVPPLAYWAVIGSFVIAIGGVIIIAMAANDGPLYGRGKMRRREEDRLFLSACLDAFLMTGQMLQLEEPINARTCADWSFHATKVIEDAFGRVHATSLFSGSKRKATVEEMALEVIQPAIMRFTGITDLLGSLRIRRGFTEGSARQTTWFKYISVECPYKFLEPSEPL